MSGEGEYPFSHRRNAKIFNSTGVPLQSKKKVGPGQRPGFPLVFKFLEKLKEFVTKLNFTALPVKVPKNGMGERFFMMTYQL